jgi:hypothetical protein
MCARVLSWAIGRLKRRRRGRFDMHPGDSYHWRGKICTRVSLDLAGPRASVRVRARAAAGRRSRARRRSSPAAAHAPAAHSMRELRVRTLCARGRVSTRKRTSEECVRVLARTPRLYADSPPPL